MMVKNQDSNFGASSSAYQGSINSRFQNSNGFHENSEQSQFYNGGISPSIRVKAKLHIIKGKSSTTIKARGIIIPNQLFMTMLLEFLVIHLRSIMVLHRLMSLVSYAISKVIALLLAYIEMLILILRNAKFVTGIIILQKHAFTEIKKETISHR